MKNTLQHRRWLSRIRRLAASAALAFPVVLVPALVANQLAQAQTFTVLYSFTGMPDGANPYAGLIRDAAGNLYGTTSSGGMSDGGTVFMLDTTGKEIVLHRFTDRDGAEPLAGLVRDATTGNFYGTTAFGGRHHSGTVFMLDTTGKETVLHSFTGRADGLNPEAGLIRDAAGNLLGTTFGGGHFGSGTVFKLHATGKGKVLHSFNGTNGAVPVAGLIRDGAGNLYGTTRNGGASNQGTVFMLDTTGKETVLHSFTGQDGRFPLAGLIRDEAGNLYGTTSDGGAFFYGAVFKLDTTGKETVLYSFTGGADGSSPQAGLIRDSAGNLFGTAFGGGSFNNGTVFKLDATGQETVLHSFAGGADGFGPRGGLILDEAGNFYGTTFFGGASNQGTVFKLTH
jgi:uncharacterized repeat protein (TIGR03803 family)